MREQGLAVNAGMHIPYVIVIPPPPADPNAPATQRAFHPDWVKRSGGKVDIDVRWYLSNQIHPPLSRLLAVIEGTSAPIIASCLNLDPSKYDAKDAAAVTPAFSTAASAGRTVADRFASAERLRYFCKTCGATGEWGGVFFFGASMRVEVGLRVCPAGCEGGGASALGLRVGAARLVRRSVRRYFELKGGCDDATCGIKTGGISTATFRREGMTHGELGRW
jgi:DNA polymerase alpha subunit A